MKGERFARQIARLVEGRRSGDKPGKIGKRIAVIVVVVFVDEGDVLTHGVCLRVIPAYFSMLRSLPFGRLFRRGARVKPAVLIMCIIEHGYFFGPP